MRLLVVFAHPLRESFMRDVLGEFTAGAREAGHEVEVADLYREGFQPIMQPADYAQFEDRPMPPDVLREQARVEAADGIALIYPIFWFSFPAILKGWFDRVWSTGWAFADTERPSSILPGRDWTLICSGGLAERTYEKYGYREPLLHILRVGTLGYCGVRDARIRIFFEVDRDGSEELKRGYLAEARELGRTAIGSAPSLS